MLRCSHIGTRRLQQVGGSLGDTGVLLAFEHAFHAATAFASNPRVRGDTSRHVDGVRVGWLGRSRASPCPLLGAPACSPRQLKDTGSRGGLGAMLGSALSGDCRFPRHVSWSHWVRLFLAWWSHRVCLPLAGCLTNRAFPLAFLCCVSVGVRASHPAAISWMPCA